MRAGAALIAALGSLIIGCGSSGDSGGGTTGPAPTISLALAPTAGSAAQGTSTSLTARVTGANGFVGPAIVSVAGAPAGVVVSVSSPQLAATVTTSTVTVDVGKSVAPAVYTLTVTASGSGVTSVNGSFALTVLAAAPTGGFSLSTSPTGVTVSQGSSTTSTISVSRTGGFGGTVSLAVSGMSSGLAATFTPASVAGQSATLSLNATSLATTGTATLTITGVSPGAGSQTATLQVTISAAQSGNGNVAVDFTNCSSPAKPVWFAYQDGSGSWARVSSASDVFRFSVTSNVGGFAYATRADNDHSTVVVTLLSSAELTAAPIPICPAAVGNKTATVTMAALGVSQAAFVSLGGSTAEARTEGVDSITRVPNGSFDVVGWRFNDARGINTALDTRAVIIRDVNVPDGQSAGAVDFASADVILPSTWSVSFGGAVSGEAFSGSMLYYTGPRESCSAALLYDFSNAAPSVPAGTYGIPEQVQRATDFHVLKVVATKFPSTRIAQQSFHTAGSVTSLDLHDPITAPVVSDLTTAYKRLSVKGSTPSIYSSMMTFSYIDAAGARVATIQASVSALGGNAATLTFPDFAAIAGWDNVWMPAAGAAVNWTFGGTHATYTGLPCVEGVTFDAAYYSGSM